jgi:O-antigen ligase
VAATADPRPSGAGTLVPMSTAALLWRGRGRAGLVALAAALALLVAAAQAHGERAFSVRYSTNDTGSTVAAAKAASPRRR